MHALTIPAEMVAASEWPSSESDGFFLQADDKGSRGPIHVSHECAIRRERQVGVKVA